MAESLPAVELRQRLDFDDAALLAECAVDTYRASGPGGQKRNKTSSAVRLRHGPSGLSVIAEESRSQHENKATALERLREALAVHVRLPVADAARWPDEATPQNGRIRVGARNPVRFHVMALLLDEVAAADGELPPVAERLGVSASQITRWLADHPAAWAALQRIRAEFGRRPLRA